MRLDFDTAIFDLDGTLLDSMYVWKRIDEIFFGRRSLPHSDEYGKALAGLSFEESARYTVDYYGLNESTEDILNEWMELAAHEYACNVQLKPGAKEYLTFLKRMNVKLCVATALPEKLYLPCLRHLGIADMFDALCSTDDTGKRGKNKGEVYSLACRRAGSKKENCVVFEDILTGIRGAKYAGMRNVCVHEPASVHDRADLEAEADICIDDYFDLLSRRRCVIFTAHCEGDPAKAYEDRREGDVVICADGGWRIAASANIEPDIVIGDFDSSAVPKASRVIRFPVEKDDTDTMLCVKYALEMGLRDILVIGGIGGRIDHTIANLQMLQYLSHRGAACRMSDGRTDIFAVTAGSICVEPTKGKFAVFAAGGAAEGVTIIGGKYEAKDIVLKPDDPLAMGNDFKGEKVIISVKKGTLLVTREHCPENS